MMPRSFWRRRWPLMLMLLAGVAGCTPREDAEPPRGAVVEVRDTVPYDEPIGDARPGEVLPAGDATPGQFTAGIVAEARPGLEPATLREVRAFAHEVFDRVVWEFDDLNVPGYHLEYIDRPVRECGSGHVVEVAGDGWLRVRLEPARAHEFVGERAQVTVRDRDRPYDFPVLKQLTLTCDFEAQVEWVLGVSSPNRYRVTELHEPARLVVDVLH